MSNGFDQVRLGFDAVSVGSAKIDAYLFVHDANLHFRLNKDTNEFCVRFGEKVIVDKCAFALGGNAANVAVGLSRLGLKTGMYAEIGDDELSQRIINTFKKEKVVIDHIKQSKNQETSLSVILNFKNDRTIFSEHVYRNHDFNFDNLSTKWVYLTSIGEEWKNAYAKVADFVKQTKAKLAFNPGTLQINGGYESIKTILALTDILFVNKEEAIEISKIKNQPRLNRGQKSKIEDILIKLQKLGPKIVVITDGKNGSYALDEKGEMLKQDRVQCKVVEKTGAGDSYTTGFLAAILNELPIKTAMKWGSINAASVIGQIGAQAGLLTISKLKSQISKPQFKSDQ